jgi:predicted DNA-binding protein (MmcQ/YjbR family)
MNIEQLQEYCLRKEEVEETFPFGPDTLVYKVKGKVFLLTPGSIATHSVSMQNAIPTGRLNCGKNILKMFYRDFT